MNKERMLNNIQVHNQTLCSYMNSLLTERHRMSALCSQSLISIHTTFFVL